MLPPKPRQFLFAVTIFGEQGANELAGAVAAAVAPAIVTPVEYRDGLKVVGETQRTLGDELLASLITGRVIERGGEDG